MFQMTKKSMFIQRRSKFNPLYNSYIVCGVNSSVSNKHEPFLGMVNMLGVTYKNPYIATGMGAYFAQVKTRIIEFWPNLRKIWHFNLANLRKWV